MHRGARAAITLTTLGLLAAFAAPTAPPPSPGPEDAASSHGEAAIDMLCEVLGIHALGVSEGRVASVRAPQATDVPVTIAVPVEDEVLELDLFPHSNRSDLYQVLAEQADGALTAVEPSPVRTMRGTVRGHDGSRVAASLLDGGLHASIDLGEGTRLFVEPLARVVPGAGDRHLVYDTEHVLPHGGTCDMLVPDDRGAEGRGAGAGGAGGGGAGGGGVAGAGSACVAQLACDADYEYFLAYGSVSAVESRINSIINTVNLQYESEVGLTHLITTIIVRTAEPDPYSSTNASTLLNQFRNHWLTNHTNIVRDTAELFTGKEIDSSTIGIAWLGAICTSYGFSVVQSDFNGNFGCATDLSAHELGHNWNADHCSCTSNTMNPWITCANTFHPDFSVPEIIAFRDSRTCLDGQCPSGPDAPANDRCADAVPFNDGSGDGVIAFDTRFADTDGPANPANTCNDSGENQTHSDVWYTYTASCSGTLTVSTCDDVHGAGAPTYDTDLVVYGPYASAAAIDCSGASLLANLAGCNDDDAGNPCGTAAPWSSTVTLSAVSSGNTYLIRVGGWSAGDQGTGWLSVDCSGTTPTTEACCLSTGGCELLTPADCTAAGGTPQGAGSSCADSDGDGTLDCDDGCPNDPNKTAPGDCGCGTPDTDSDGDGTPDCNDGCPNDANKTAPGACGCGTPDTDSDGDGTPDCNDGCPNDPNKTAPGDCGCGNPDTDSDGDGTADCVDGCPNDPDKITAGDCGCGNPDTDSDGDGTADCVDGCPNDPGKTAPGACGCGTPDTDSDGDGTPDCADGCPNDPAKTAPGACGCGVSDADSDGDGTPDCSDPCPSDPLDECGDDVISLTTGDFATARGTVSGDHSLTHADDGNAQELTEEIVGNPNNGRSRLDHTWTITVAPGLLQTFNVEASHDPSLDGDEFQLSYSRDNSTWTAMLTVTPGADDLQSYTFSEDVTGTLYLRVEDTNGKKGNTDLDTLLVDHMFVVSSTSVDPASTAHVASIVVSTVSVGQGNKKGRAVVTIVDNLGVPVGGATVTGDFSGDIIDPGVTGQTDPSGVAVLETQGTAKGGVSITFCVTGVDATPLVYDAGDNAESCDGN